jgi:hypothetical protein
MGVENMDGTVAPRGLRVVLVCDAGCVECATQPAPSWSGVYASDAGASWMIRPFAS